MSKEVFCVQCKHFTSMYQVVHFNNPCDLKKDNKSGHCRFFIQEDKDKVINKCMSQKTT